MLDKEEIYCHFIWTFWGYFWYPCKKSLTILFTIEIISVVTKVELKWRIRYYVVEFHKFSSCLMMRVFDRISFYNIRDWVDEVIQYQIETEKSGRFLRYILRVDRASIFSYSMSKIHEEGTRASGWIIARYILYRSIYHNCRHNLCYCMWRIVFSILSTPVFVVILYEVFKYRREEIKLLVKNFFETKFYQLVYYSPSKVISFPWLYEILRKLIKELYLCSIFSTYWKYFCIYFSYISECVIE